MDEAKTIRQTLIDAAGLFERIDAAVFTTFNFSPDFFENNVLPAVFGIESTTEGVRRTMVNTKLVETDVCVFYDASMRPKNSGIYRYQSAGVVLPGRFFHPKMIILSGTNIHDGTAQIYLAVLSANLSLSGWGKNAEVYTDLWLDPSDQANCSELRSALEWLKQRFLGGGPAEIPALDRIIEGIDLLPPDTIRRKDDHVHLYFSPLHKEGLFDFIAARSGIKRWEELLVFSPYWGDVALNLQGSAADQAILVPALIPAASGKYGLGKDQLKDLTGVALKRLAERGDIRLWHAKAYRFRNSEDCWMATGSSNFTNNGLAGGEAGNVEAMIVRRSALEDTNTRFPDLKNLEDEDNLPPENLSEDVPEPMVFDIRVNYDWLKKSYSILFKPPEEECYENFRIELPGSPRPLKLTLEDNEIIDQPAEGPLRSKLFRLHYLHRGQGQVFEGLILEFNLAYSPKAYTRRLSWFEILENWTRHASDPTLLIPPEDNEEGLPGGAYGDDYDSAGKHEEDGADEEEIDVLNFYEMYRNFFEYRTGVFEAVEAGDTQRLEQLLIKRPDSIYKLAYEASNADGHRVPRFLVLEECRQLLGACDDVSIRGLKRCASDIQKWTRELRASVCAALDAPNTGMNPDDLLDWFSKEFEKAWKD